MEQGGHRDDGQQQAPPELLHPVEVLLDALDAFAVTGECLRFVIHERLFRTDFQLLDPASFSV